MAAGPGSQQSLRKALKTVGLAKANGDFKVLDVAISKATNHDGVCPKEKHVAIILRAVSFSRPRAEVVYCIHGLATRLSKTRDWKVALKTVIVVHRAMREVDDTFFDALLKYSWSRGHMLNMDHLRDESSISACDVSYMVRRYASYLEERLECFRILKYDVQRDHSRLKELDTPLLLRQLPALQQLLSRLLDCQPLEGTISICLIQCALTMVASESAKLYAAITDGVVNLVDKFFEMQHDDAVRALEIYKKSICPAAMLSEFFEVCRSLNFVRGMNFIKIQQPPMSFVNTMEDYVKEAPRIPMLQHTPDNHKQDAAPKETAPVESDLLTDDKEDDNIEEKSNDGGTVHEPPRSDQSEASATSQIADLLSFDDLILVTSESNEKNSLPLANVQYENPSDSISDGLNSTCTDSSWEAHFAAPSSNGAAVAETKLAGGLDRSTLDSLYDSVMTSTPNQNGFYHHGQIPSNPFDEFGTPFLASSNARPPTNNMQMVVMAQQQGPLFDSSNAAPPTNMQMGVMAQQGPFASSNATPQTNIMQMGFMAQLPDPFYASNNVAPPTNVQLAAMAQQQYFMIQQQQQQQQLPSMGHNPTNSFSGNPFII